MIATLVEKRESAWLAVVVAAVGALGLLVILADDLFARLLHPGTTNAVALVIGLIAMSAIGPWLARGSVGRPVRIVCERERLRLDDRIITASDVAAVSIANAAHGASVAIARNDNEVVFVAVENVGDARRIACALGGAREAVPIRRASKWLAFVQVVFSIVSAASAILYWGGVTHTIPFVTHEVGLVGALVGQLAILLLLVRCLARGHAVAPGRSAWDAHVAIHLDPTSPRAETELDVTTQALVRGDETIEAWLARVDGLPALESAYRAGALDKESLWRTLRDAGARPDARIAAARLLHRRFHEERDELIRVATDPDVRIRIEAVATDDEDDHDERDQAPSRLASLGPLFRAQP